MPAILVRELAYTLGLLPRPEEPDAAAQPEAVSEPAAPDEDEAAAPATAAEPNVESEAPETAAASAATELDGAQASAEPEPVGSTEPAEAANSAESDPTAAPGARDRLDAGWSGNEAAAARLAALFGLRAAGTALAHLPAIAIVDELSGQLLALTDAARIRHTAACGRSRCRTGKRACTHPPRGPGLGPPGDTDGYSPAAELQRFVRARDRRCRFPGCRAAAIRCDLDHNRPWPGGATSADNLCCLCRHHHRLSHQAPGWTMTRLPDGGLRWTTPSGETITTHPPRYGADDDLPPATVGPPDTATATRPVGILEQLRRWPPPPQDPNDPAPF